MFFNHLWRSSIDLPIMRPRRALVAQLDRASGYEPEGRGFDSLPAHQLHFSGEVAEWSKALPC